MQEILMNRLNVGHINRLHGHLIIEKNLTICQSYGIRLSINHMVIEITKFKLK